MRLQRTVAGVEAVQALLGFGLAAVLLFDYLARAGEGSAALLLIYWALHLPVLGQDVALTARQYPALRSAVLRLLEPLEAPEEKEVDTTQDPALSGDVGVELELQGVSVQGGGHTILEALDLSVEAGCHVAVVGPCLRRGSLRRMHLPPLRRSFYPPG